MPDQHWPERMAVQRHEQDDPHRPFKYVVLDGTQSTDFSNTESYGLVRAVRKQRDEELRERLLDSPAQEAGRLAFMRGNAYDATVAERVETITRAILDSIFEEADGG